MDSESNLSKSDCMRRRPAPQRAAREGLVKLLLFQLGKNKIATSLGGRVPRLVVLHVAVV